jgi:stage II sporulation protein Q
MHIRRKSLLIPTLYLLAVFSITAGLYFTKRAYESANNVMSFDNITYVSNDILNRTVPIINTPDIFTNPYPNEEMKIARYYYHAEADDEKKKESIVYYNGTYMPNTGIDYVNKDQFEVTSIYDGTVIDVSNDEILGKTVKIRHSGEIISVYQGLSEIIVNKGDMVFQGQKIGISGTSKLNESLGNHLHFEIYKNGETIDPLLCIGKKIGDI